MASLKGNNTCSSSIPDRSLNLWDDDFVQSMETPYEGSEYHERVETLVNEVKMLLKEMQTQDCSLIERLEMVDALQCFGIDRYFKAEIKEILDYVYRCWDESVGLGLQCESITKNLNATALGLRLLRLHRYDVSGDVLENFKDKNGQFFFSGENKDDDENKNEEHVMRSMLNLLRSSSVAFTGETIMEEAKLFSSAYLKQIIEKPGDTYRKSFVKEVEYALLYEWSRTFSRWEARNFIEIYELDILRLKDKKILELAKLNFNILQFTYKTEMKKLSSWWTDSRVSKSIAGRQRTIEYLLLAVSIADEVDFSSSRIAVAKTSVIITILDDLFDDYLTLEQIELITKSIVQGWDISLIQNLPKNFKAAIEFCFKTVHELASDATKKQGRDMMQFITKTWTDYIEGNLQQARWNKSGYVPTYNEYIRIAATTAAIGPISLHAILLAAPVAEDNVIEKIFHNQSRFYELIWLCTRLVDDIHDFEDDKLHGQTSSAISSYMKDHPEFSEDGALNHINGLLNQFIKELTWEFLNPNNNLLDWEGLSFNINRGMQCFYVFGHGFSYHDKGVKERIFKVLIDPVKI
ncbi:delta-selinene-like synthase, chloroplastic [Cryptomeria japonica]|uniref:delta-selinene-like synthase, chloroplastic n=1 Tax=Cryptomeria japonica TaxID=3369 RepID=UPI0027DA642F|nr:delta-selinene-like synthase, chloroplastic [Cryptomeria japonica]